MVSRSITARLIAPLIISMLLHFGLAAAVIFSQNSISEAEAQVNAAQQRVIRLSELRSISRSLQRDALNLIFEVDPKERSVIIARFQTRMDKFGRELSALERQDAPNVIPPTYFATQHAVADRLAEVARDVDLGNQQQAIETFRYKVRPEERTASKFADEFIDRAEKNVAVLRAKEASAKEFTHLIIFGSLIAMAIALILLVDLLRNIIPALRRIHGVLHRLASGDLDFEFGSFELLELQTLLPPLESFRLNALAVKNLAYTDSSTGMHNRHAFLAMVEDRLAQGAGYRELGYAIVVADVDRFKHINDDYGHAAGDELIRLIGHRMEMVFGPRTIIARIGGDEFALCVPITPDRSVEAIGKQLVAGIEEPFDLEAFSVLVTLSVGVAAVTTGTVDVTALISQADMALYASKKKGRNCSTVFTTSLEVERKVTRALERELSEAMANGQLRLVYQPIVALAGNELEVEALVRWLHPSLGEISPTQFIAAAERSGQIVPVGQWIITQALADMQAWPWLTLSLNISALQLQQEGFVGFLLQA